MKSPTWPFKSESQKEALAESHTQGSNPKSQYQTPHSIQCNSYTRLSRPAPSSQKHNVGPRNEPSPAPVFEHLGPAHGYQDNFFIFRQYRKVCVPVS